MRRKKEEVENDHETLAYKTLKCPLLSEGEDWEKLATALPLSTLLQYEDIVSRWCRSEDKRKSFPICKWLRGEISTDKILALSMCKKRKQ